MRRLFRTLKFENAGIQIPGCPTKDYTNTVTLCGKCIDATELGNIAYGYATANRLDVMLFGGLYAEVRGRKPRGFNSHEELAISIASKLMDLRGGNLCDRLAQLINTSDIKYIRQRVNDIYAVNYQNWLVGGGDVVADWNKKHRSALGEWDDFLDETINVLSDQDGDGALGIGEIKECSPCEAEFDGADIKIADNGEIKW